MGSIRFTPVVWLFLAFIAYVEAQFAFLNYDIADTQAGKSITVTYGGTTYPVIFTLDNGDTGVTTIVGTSTGSPFTFTIPPDQEAAYYTIEGDDGHGGDDSTDSFQIASAPANSPAATGPAATSSTANRAGATASAPATSPTSTSPATPTTTTPAAVATSTTPAAVATSTTPAAIATTPPAVATTPSTSSAETSTSPLSTSLPNQQTTPPSNPTSSPPLTASSTYPTPQRFSPTPSTHPLTHPSSFPTSNPYRMGGLFGSNSTYANGSSARGVMMPSASSSYMRGLNGSGERSQFWIVGHKECRGGCGAEAFTGTGVRVFSGGLVAVVWAVVMAMVGGLVVV